MEACEEVADWTADCTDCFSSRLSSLNLSCTSQTFDPAFTFDTSSRSSSLRHPQLCESTSRSTAPDASPAAPTLLASVSPSPRESYRRHVTVTRRASLPSGHAETEPVGNCSASGWSPSPSGPVGPAPAPVSAADASASCHGGVEYSSGPASFVGVKRRSCPEPPALQSSQQHGEGTQPAMCSEALPPVALHSPASSFASFAAALAAHYYADFGSVPDVPAHLDEVRLRGSKRQRVFSLEQLADA